MANIVAEIAASTLGTQVQNMHDGTTKVLAKNASGEDIPSASEAQMISSFIGEIDAYNAETNTLTVTFDGVLNGMLLLFTSGANQARPERIKASNHVAGQQHTLQLISVPATAPTAGQTVRVGVPAGEALSQASRRPFRS